MEYFFGLAGLSFAIIAWGQVSEVKKEVGTLKKQLEQKGIIEKQQDKTA